MKTIYFDHHAFDALRADRPPRPFLSGEAGAVWVDEEGVFETETTVIISPNSLHSMDHHGVIDQLAELELQMGALGDGMDAVLAPASAEGAARIFYEADRMTYGARHDLLIEEIGGADPTQYRIVVDNREYQRTLSRLQVLANTAARHGHGIRLRV